MKIGPQSTCITVDLRTRAETEVYHTIVTALAIMSDCSSEVLRQHTLARFTPPYIPILRDAVAVRAFGEALAVFT